MKKIMIIAIILMAIVLILGISWGKLFKRGYTQDECGVELAKRDHEPRDWYLFHKFLVDPSDMEEHMPNGFKHIKAKATEGVDILIEEIKKL